MEIIKRKEIVKDIHKGLLQCIDFSGKNKDNYSKEKLKNMTAWELIDKLAISKEYCIVFKFEWLSIY